MPGGKHTNNPQINGCGKYTGIEVPMTEIPESEQYTMPQGKHPALGEGAAEHMHAPIRALGHYSLVRKPTKTLGEAKLHPAELRLCNNIYAYQGKIKHPRMHIKNFFRPKGRRNTRENKENRVAELEAGAKSMQAGARTGLPDVESLLNCESSQTESDTREAGHGVAESEASARISEASARISEASARSTGAGECTRPGASGSTQDTTRQMHTSLAHSGAGVDATPRAHPSAVLFKSERRGELAERSAACADSIAQQQARLAEEMERMRRVRAARPPPARRGVFSSLFCCI